MAIIYKISNPIGQSYIGSTNGTLSQRKACHKYGIKRGNKSMLYQSFRQYGFQAHSFELVTTVKKEDRFELEHFIIQEGDPGLNMVKKYNATATHKIWVNDGVKEFQIYPDQFNESLTRGRLFDIASVGRSNKGRKRLT